MAGLYHAECVFWRELRPIFVLFVSWVDGHNVSSIWDQVDWQDMWAGAKL